MWSRTQNYPLNSNDDDQLSIINRYFDFMNNIRRLNTRIIEQNDNLAEMGYEMVIAYIYSSRSTNINSNNNSNTNSNTNSSRPTNNSRRRSRNNRTNSGSRNNIANRYTNLRNDWRNINRNNRDAFTRNVRPRNFNTNNVNRNNLQSPLTHMIPMFGPLTFQPPSNNNNLEQLFQQALQPVPIRPTNEQIERATEERRFDEILQPINDTCPITRNRFNNSDNVLQILECRHCFTPNSLRTWFESSVRCPICRYDIREYNPMNVVNNPYRNVNTNNNDNNNDDDNDNNDDDDNHNDNNDDDNDINNDIQSPDTQEDDDNDTVDTTNSQDLARELVMNELNNINNNPLITEQQRNLANIISQSITAPTTNEELIQTETSIDSNGNLNLTYQFGVNLPPSQ